MCPTYVFRNKKSGRRFERYMSINERELYLKEHPELKQELTVTAIVSEHGDTRRKTDEGFKDILRTIKKKHIRSNIDAI